MPSSQRNALARAFSLVEVVLALGVASFALMALIATLPAGIKSVEGSMSDSAQANILQQLRAELEQVPFGNNSGGTSYLTTLTQTTNYYTDEGFPTNAAGAYYMATFQTNSAPIPGTNATSTPFQTSSAVVLQVTLSYPSFAPTANQTMITNYLFAAKQKSY